MIVEFLSFEDIRFISLFGDIYVCFTNNSQEMMHIYLEKCTTELPPYISLGTVEMPTECNISPTSISSGISFEDWRNEWRKSGKGSAIQVLFELIIEKAMKEQKLVMPGK